MIAQMFLPVNNPQSKIQNRKTKPAGQANPGGGLVILVNRVDVTP
jgi:hypothetical protein